MDSKNELVDRLPEPAGRGIRCLVTAGPTREYFDPVRYLSNPSSGKMGFALAEAALAAGWQVDLVAGPVCLTPPEGARVHRVVTGEEMLGAVESLFPLCDLLIMTAAVMDYRPADYSAEKLKKSADRMTAELLPTVDILKTVAARAERQMVVGFAAETGDVEEHAWEKLRRKGCHYIVANRVGGESGGFESDENRVILLGRDGTRREYGPDLKSGIARDLVAAFAERLMMREGSA